MFAHDRDDPACGQTIPVGTHPPRHRAVCFRIAQQPARFLDDRPRVLADQPRDSSLDRLGALALAPHDENRFAQRGRFLLHAAGVGQNERRPASSPTQTSRKARVDRDALAGTLASDASTTGRTDGLGWTGQRNSTSRMRSWSSWIARQISRSGSPNESRRWAVTRTMRRRGVELDTDRHVAPGRRQECIDHRVARDEDPLGVDPFSLQVLVGLTAWARNGSH